MSRQSDDSERDTRYLLSPSHKVNVPPRRQFHKLRGLWSSFSKHCYQRHQDIKDRINLTFSIVTAPTSMPTTPGQEPSLRSESPPRRGKMYYIISEVSSEAMRAEQEQAWSRTFSSVWNEEDEEPQRPSRRCVGLARLSLSHCFAGTALRDVVEQEEKEVVTIPVSVECDEMSYLLSDDDTNISIMETELPPSSRLPVSAICVPNTVKYTRNKNLEEMRVSTDYPCQCRRVRRAETRTHRRSTKPVEDNEYSMDEPSTDHRDDSNTNRHNAENRERLHLLLLPALVQLRNQDNNPSQLLGVEFPHPGTIEEPFYPTLGIHSAHPHWLERESTNVWEEMDLTSFFLDDGEETSLRPSPIQVESWTDNKWMEDPSLAHSIIDDKGDEKPPCNQKESTHRLSPIPVESCNTRNWMDDAWFLPSMPTNKEKKFKNVQEKRFPKDDEASPPMDWTRKIYQPIFRFAQEISTCGQLHDVDEAPFDEVNDDRSRTVLEDVNLSRRKVGIQPLKPNPKDSPSYAWLRQIGLPRNPLWDDFLK